MKLFNAILLSLILITSGLLPVFGQTNSSQEETMSISSIEEDTSIFLNPEKGWFQIYTTDYIYGFNKLKERGINTILLEADLGDFLTSPISAAKLNEIRSAFSEARSYSLSVIFRAGYNFTGESQCEPKDITIITNHIKQLKEIFYENEDILYTVQAGFLGPWGEWHSSYYGNPIPLSVQSTIVSEMLDAVPVSVPIQLRRPMYIRGIFNSQTGGSTLTESEAFSGSALSRVGYFNDALLSTADDYGTYVEQGYTREKELAWVDNHAKYTPFVAETNYLSNYSDPDNAIYELNLLHAQILNQNYHPDVISKWKQTTYQGQSTYDFITDKLGYRFTLHDVGVQTDIKKGGSFHIQFQIENTGFGNLIKEKDFEVILEKGGQSYSAKVNEDPRRWYKENGVMTKDLYFSIPKDMESGDWNVYFRLSSPWPELKNNPEYSVRLANVGVWNAQTGDNLVGSINISAEDAEETYTEFNQIAMDEEVVSPPVVFKAIDCMKISNDEENIYILVEGTGISDKNQFYINADSDSSTGFQFKWLNSGFEYLIENSKLYAYNGIDNSWSWTNLQVLSMERSDSSLLITLPVSAVSIKDNAFQIGFLSEDNDELSYPLVSVGHLMSYALEQPEEELSAGPMKISNNEKEISFTITGESLDKKSQLFIDIDNNVSTGYWYEWKECGFEYLVENDILYQYTGTNNSWGWTKVNAVTMEKTPNLVSITIPLDCFDLTAGNSIAFGFISNDNKKEAVPLLQEKLSTYVIK